MTELILVELKILPDQAAGMTYCLVDKWGNDIPHEFGTSTLIIVNEFSSALFILCPLLLTAIPMTILKIKKRRSL